MKLTKKIASEIFRMIVGTDKGMEKFQSGSEDRWVMESGILTVILKDELKYDFFGHRVEGDHWFVSINMDYGDPFHIYIKKQPLEIDDDFNDKKFEERREALRGEVREAMGC